MDMIAIGKLVIPVFPAFAFTQLQTAFVQSLPAGIGEGAMSIFGYATRLHTSVEQIFVIGVGTVLLPHLSTLVANDDRAAIRSLMTRIVLCAAAAAAFVQIAIWLFGDWAVELLLARGNFTTSTAFEVSQLWFYLALGTFPFAVSTVLSKLAMALQRPIVLAITAAALLLLVSGLAASMPADFGITEVALLLVIAQCARVVIYSILIRVFSARPQVVRADNIQ